MTWRRRTVRADPSTEGAADAFFGLASLVTGERGFAAHLPATAIPRQRPPLSMTPGSAEAVSRTD